MSRPGIDRIARAGMVALVLAGCAPTPSAPVRPALDLPAAWPGQPATGKAIDVARWWRIFGDSRLDQLVTEALANNLDLAMTIARVDEARGLLAQADADRMPLIDATAQADRSRVSRRTSVQQPAGTPTERNNLRATINASYEIDLWDRLRNASAAARAELLAAEAARDTVRIALAAQAAQSYFTLRALDAQLDVTRRSIGLRERALELQRKRVEAGVLAELDLRQLEAELAAVRAQLAPLEGARSREEAALALLLGRSPRAIMADTVVAESGSTLAALAAVVPAGLPSELLLRRPDIVEAEQRLAAANARVAIARVAHFPSIALTGYLGVESAALGSLFSGPAGIWRAALALAQPIYAGGRLEVEIDIATARERQALAHYESVIQSAFRDVRSALASQAQARASYDAEQARILALQESVRLARLRYEGGLSSQLELLDAERNLLAAEINRIDALRAQHAAVANLMHALGGGWQ
ncbi:MAG: efflux transporter outer membrane subunit [Burkholderiales bacterium]|nr:efflux transporter outer membrane subunit [Burkholderiales bacterium]